jgi:hypothetical protein
LSSSVSPRSRAGEKPLPRQSSPVPAAPDISALNLDVDLNVRLTGKGTIAPGRVAAIVVVVAVAAILMPVLPVLLRPVLLVLLR